MHGQRMARLARHHTPSEMLAAVRNEIMIRYPESSVYDAEAVAAAVFRALTMRKLDSAPGSAWALVDSISVREGEGIRVVPADLDEEVAAIEREVIAAASR